MKLRSVLLMSAIAAGLPLAGFAAEVVISFDSQGGKVVGTLSLPEGGPAPVGLPTSISWPKVTKEQFD